jgi:hypothetical protein
MCMLSVVNWTAGWRRMLPIGSPWQKEAQVASTRLDSCRVIVAVPVHSIKSVLEVLGEEG